MAGQRFARCESVAEELRQQVLLFGQGGDAVADVARRKHPEFLPQRAGAAAFVRHGDDCPEAGDGPRSIPIHVLLQSAKKRGKAGASTNGNDVEAAVAHMWLLGY